MGQGLKGAPHTYSQFTDLVYGPLPSTKGSGQTWPTVIGDHGGWAFKPFMDDHLGASTDFETLYSFLRDVYFPRSAFGPVYLAPHKMHVFTDSLDLLGFTGDARGLWPPVKHRQLVADWPTPRNRDELDAFIWLTPFLRIFIPGRADHVMRLKEAYQEEVAAELPPKQPAG
ncbi:MAG: hypothetical protein M1823_006977 [Watsoniomyces obsoletus]|nr:MAG: hypothetical protein M1823_006977 [Watsoniomyces obsoletus]